MSGGTGTGAEVDYATEFAAGAEWLAGHISRAGVRSAVPACPRWTVLDMVTHLGNVHAWAATVVETGGRAVEPQDRPPSARPRRVAGWYLAKAEDLYSVLRDSPPDRPCWNFAFGSGDVRFWARRQLHEVLMHGVDLAQAGGLEERLPTRLAADGVDEALEVFLHRMHRRGHPADLTAPLCLRASDVDRSWVVEPAPASSDEDPGDPAAPLVHRGHRSAVDLIEAPAVVLLKVLWKRAPATHPELRTSGDRDRVARFLDSRLTS